MPPYVSGIGPIFQGTAGKRSNKGRYKTQKTVSAYRLTRLETRDTWKRKGKSRIRIVVMEKSASAFQRHGCCWSYPWCLDCTWPKQIWTQPALRIHTNGFVYAARAQRMNQTVSAAGKNTMFIVQYTRPFRANLFFPSGTWVKKMIVDTTQINDLAMWQSLSHSPTKSENELSLSEYTPALLCAYKWSFLAKQLVWSITPKQFSVVPLHAKHLK